MAETGFQRRLIEEVQHFPTALPGLAAAEQGFLDKSSTSQAMLTDDEYDRGMHRLRSDIEAANAAGNELQLSADLALFATKGWLIE